MTLRRKASGQFELPITAAEAIYFFGRVAALGGAVHRDALGAVFTRGARVGTWIGRGAGEVDHRLAASARGVDGLTVWPREHGDRPPDEIVPA